MFKITKWLSSIAFLFLLQTSCTKVDVLKKSEEITTQSVDISTSHINERYAQIVEFLESKKEISNETVAKKIEMLLKNISNSISEFNFDDSILIAVCDLAEYKNELINEYAHTYYKIYFPLINSTIEDGLIYTIHTSLSIEQIDEDFENIFKQESSTFSGVITINQLSDEFMQEMQFENGRLIKTISLNIYDENGVSAAQGMGSTCTAYYLNVREWVNGVIVSETSELLYIDCGGCGGPLGQSATMVMNDNCAGGGGSGSTGNSNPNPYFITNDIYDDDIASGTENTCKNGIRYHAQIIWAGQPAKPLACNAWPAYYVYPTITCSVNNVACTATRTVGFHTPIVTPLSSRSWYCKWGHMAYYRYNFGNGNIETGEGWRVHARTVKD